MLKDDQYYELDEEIISYVKKIELEFGFAIDIKYKYITNNKQKTMIQIKKIPDNYAVLLNSELLVSVNDEYFSKFDEEIRTILISQEFDKIHINFDKGTFKISQPTLKTSVGLIKRYSYDKIERANESERLLSESKLQSENEDKLNK